MEMSYSIVLVFGGGGGGDRILYRETKVSYEVSDQNNPKNHPIYVVDEDMGLFILSVNEEYNEVLTLSYFSSKVVVEVDGVWRMRFDGAYSKEGVGAGVVFISPTRK
jgi:hypothetical protein